MIAVWVVRILLWTGVLAVVTGSLGILFARTVFDRLHYAGLVSSVGTVGVAAAVAIHEGWSQAGLKSALIGLIILFANPLVTHATARAARVRQYGKLMPDPQEGFDSPALRDMAAKTRLAVTRARAAIQRNTSMRRTDQ